jgi:5-bromo-4-chloroindolyl phosphate hydrolysis protein
MTLAQRSALVPPRSRALALLLLPSPLLLKAVVSLWSGDLQAILATGGSYALFVVAALLVRRGVVQVEAVRRRPRSIAFRPPWKRLGSLAAGIATAVAAFAAAGHGVAIALVFAVAAAVGVRLFYGADPPLRADGLTVGDAGGDEFERALADANGRLDRIEAIAAGLPSPEFQQRLRNIARLIAELLVIIEDEPANFALARRFLNVYLDSALQVMEKYSRVFPRSGASELEHSFRTLLVDVENTCTAQHQSLLQRDVMDLDVQIEVLSVRLRQEAR